MYTCVKRHDPIHVCERVHVCVSQKPTQGDYVCTELSRKTKAYTQRKGYHRDKQNGYEDLTSKRKGPLAGVTLPLLLSRFSRLRLCADGSPPGSPVPGILQARTLEWVAISFSNA